MDEVDVDAVDGGNELRDGAQFRLEPPPVILAGPIVGELLERRERRALGIVVDQLLAGPSRCQDALLQVGKGFVRRAILERADCFVTGGSDDQGFGQCRAFGRRARTCLESS